MQRFDYRAKNGPSNIISGTIDASTKEEAVQKILRLGHFPIEVFVSRENQGSSSTNISRKMPSLDWRQRISLKDVGEFTRQMSDMIDAGVPILRALTLMNRQTKHAAFKSVIEQLQHDVKNGLSFSDALEKHPKTFSSLYINLIRSGEMSGKLLIVLKRLAQFIDQEVTVRAQIQSSLAYPGFIFATGILSMFVLMTFVLPRLTILFEDFDVVLPFATRLVMGMSAFFASFWWAIILGTIAIGYAGYRAINTAQGKWWLDETALTLPIIGPLLRKIEMARFARTLSTLLDGGVSIVPALESVAGVMNNVVLADYMRQVASEVKNGVSLTKALESASFDDDLVLTMVSVGEESGELAYAFSKLADTYDRESTQFMQTFVSLLGPVALVVIVAFVGFVIVSMLLPIFKMNLMVN